MARTVLIVDDHAVFRAVARVVLTEAGFVVLGEAEDGASALSSARRLRPDLVLLDVQLPDTDGFAVAAELAAGEDPPEVVLTSSRDGGDFGSLLRDCAARGFIAKERLSGAAISALCP